MEKIGVAWNAPFVVQQEPAAVAEQRVSIRTEKLFRTVAEEKGRRGVRGRKTVQNFMGINADAREIVSHAISCVNCEWQESIFA